MGQQIEGSNPRVKGYLLNTLGIVQSSESVRLIGILAREL